MKIFQDFFRVWEEKIEGPGRPLYVFLFRTKIVLTERKESEDPDEYPEFVHVKSLKLEKYEAEFEKSDEAKKFLILRPSEIGEPKFFLQPMDNQTQNSPFIPQAWKKEIAEVKETLGMKFSLKFKFFWILCLKFFQKTKKICLFKFCMEFESVFNPHD